MSRLTPEADENRRIMNTREPIQIKNHAGHELPRHPITGAPMNHVVQSYSMLVRVREDAHHLYVNDPRWNQANSMEKQFALRMLQEICGLTCPVLTVDRDNYGTFYNIMVSPAPLIPDPQGITRRFNMAFIPADYVEVVRSGFWEAQ